MLFRSDEDGERRFFVVACNPEMIDPTSNRDGAYWRELREAIDDDRVIRALYLKLLTREGVKERYFGQDIPVGEYACTLKETNRPHNEKFLVWLIQQHLDKTELVRDVDELYEADFKTWKEAGGEFDRSKASFTSWLRLRKFDLPRDTINERRVTKQKKPGNDATPTPDYIDGKRVSNPTYQVTEFLFNIPKLCAHYRILLPDAEQPPGGCGLNLGDSVATEEDASVAGGGATREGGAAGSSNDHHGDGAEPIDDDDEEAIEIGRAHV